LAFKKSLYGLQRAPHHWYKLVSSILTSPEIGLTQCKNDPCVFIGHPPPGQPPLYLILYVDDFVYFSPSSDVESYFESALKHKMNVDFLVKLNGFLVFSFTGSLILLVNFTAVHPRRVIYEPLLLTWV
jgi:hypothetical protein